MPITGPTGIPVILEALKHNGSPEAVFETDAERTWFQVTLPIHPSFKGKAFIHVEGETEVANFKQIALINELADLVSNLVSDEEIYKEFARILLFIKENTQKREDILSHIGLTNQTFNYRNYIEPLEKVGLIAKTIPDKP